MTEIVLVSLLVVGIAMCSALSVGYRGGNAVAETRALRGVFFSLGCGMLIVLLVPILGVRPEAAMLIRAIMVNLALGCLVGAWYGSRRGRGR